MKNYNKYELKFCKFCNQPFFGLKTRIKQSKNGGSFCSKKCQSFKEFIPRFFMGKNGYTMITILKENKAMPFYLHRAIMEAWIERKLLKNESVHHKDKNVNNNNIENLEILSIKKHISLHNKKYYDKDICLITNCNLIIKGKNLCKKHYLMGWRLKNFDIDFLNQYYTKPKNRIRDKTGKFILKNMPNWQRRKYDDYKFRVVKKVSRGRIKD